jgi:hypothetical protein
MRTHEEDDTLATGAEDNVPTKKARRGGEFGRDWACSMEGCDLAFKSVRCVTLTMSRRLLIYRFATEKGVDESCEHHAQWFADFCMP